MPLCGRTTLHQHTRKGINSTHIKALPVRFPPVQVNLAILHNPMPVRDCARRNCSTLAYQDVVPLEFWAAASARTGLSEEQLQQLRFGYSEYW